MRRFNFSLFLAVLVVVTITLIACTSDKQPASPVETFQTYVKAFKKKDLTTMKLLLSNDTIKMHEQQAKAEGVTLDDVIRRDSLLGEGQMTVEYRNERIDGDRATIEYKDAGAWETMPFVREEGDWKIDKKTLADQMLRDVEQDSQQFDDRLNRERQPY